jgi:hypothetical protein
MMKPLILLGEVRVVAGDGIEPPILFRSSNFSFY